jgi:hypothetical protein
VNRPKMTLDELRAARAVWQEPATFRQKVQIGEPFAFRALQTGDKFWDWLGDL